MISNIVLAELTDVYKARLTAAAENLVNINDQTGFSSVFANAVNSDPNHTAAGVMFLNWKLDQLRAAKRPRNLQYVFYAAGACVGAWVLWDCFLRKGR
jgi:hypothetical protein